MLWNLTIPGIGVLLVAGVLFLKRAQGGWCTREMQALARRMGWSFHASPSLNAVPDRERFALFTVRMPQRMRGHLSGQVGDAQVAVFDLEHTRGGTDRPQGTEQTVVHVHVPGLDLPAFSLRPETVRHRMGDRIGGDDIDMDSDPRFSHAYLLRGADEEAVREAFSGKVRDFYHRHPDSSTDAQGSDLLFWRRGHVATPQEIPALVQTALDVAAQLGRGSRKAARV